MALSPADKQKRYRERQKVAATARRRSARDETQFLKGSLAEFLDGRSLELEETLDSLGVRINGDLLADEQHFHTDGLGDRNMLGLERLTALAGAFIDAAVELHVLLNAYKVHEIQRRLEEVESSEADPSVKLLALDALNRALRQLDKRFRRDLPEISIREDQAT